MSAWEMASRHVHQHVFMACQAIYEPKSMRNVYNNAINGERVAVSSETSGSIIQ